MSGAFHKFIGLSNNHPKVERDRSAKVGISEPCLYANHHGTKHGWRYTETGACVDCSEEQAKNCAPRFDIQRLQKDLRTRALRFWSKVDITTLDDCWKYEGSAAKKKLLFMWRRPRLKNTYSFHSIRVATWLSWGDFGNGQINSLCGERRCCNPLHNLPKQLNAVDIKNIDRGALEKQLATLKQEVNQYLLSKAEKQLLKELDDSQTVDDRAFLPLSNQQHEGFIDYDDLVTPYRSAIEETLLQLKSGAHATQLS